MASLGWLLQKQQGWSPGLLRPGACPRPSAWHLCLWRKKWGQVRLPDVVKVTPASGTCEHRGETSGAGKGTTASVALGEGQVQGLAWTLWQKMVCKLVHIQASLKRAPPRPRLSARACLFSLPHTARLLCTPPPPLAFLTPLSLPFIQTVSTREQAQPVSTSTAFNSQAVKGHLCGQSPWATPSVRPLTEVLRSLLSPLFTFNALHRNR